MSFIQNEADARVYAPGYFLAHDECTRKTMTIPQTLATTAANGTKFVKMGTVFPSNDENAIGIVYEDVDVTTGDMPGSVVTKGEIYADRLAAELDADAITALTALGFVIIETAPTVTRPE